MSQSKLRKKVIMIVDDHPIMRYGLARLIDAEEDLEICCEAGSACEALAHLERADPLPDLMLVDIALPDRSGLELIKDVRAAFEPVACLAISMHDEELYAERVLRAGGRGYIMKEEAPGKLIKAIHQVIAGGAFLSEKMSARVVEMMAGGGKSGSSVERLSDRELEVFQLIGEGKGSREIAGQLNISMRTVDAHRAHIKEKLGLRDATELMHRAVQWVETGEPV
jgi:DNA-binding NarL/FixJ family response regulator